MKLPSRQVINTIFKKLPNLSVDELVTINNSIAFPNNLVSVNINKIINKDKSFSIRLIKWVEPFIIDDVSYSLFYTEVDHNYKIGDRVLIEGGYYDSDSKINNKRYGKGVDGYKVLYVDRCRLVLDILYVGIEPSNEEPIDDFIKIYVANTQYEFDYFLQTLSMRDDNGDIENKFLTGYNNFLYLTDSFTINPGDYDGVVQFLPSTLTTNATPMFVIRSGNDLIDITSDFLINNISSYLNIDAGLDYSGFYNNGKIRIMNSKFTLGTKEFKKDYVYYFNTLLNEWVVDKSYVPTIITKQHFRSGFFKKGIFNQGLLGQHEERIEWVGDNVEWNLGTVLNVDWKSGVLGSNHFYEKSTFSVLDRTDLPIIRSNSENNGGAGYNYVFNTDFSGGDVINGNIFNLSTFYGTFSSTSVLENYLINDSINYSVTLSGGVYYNSDILFAKITNSTLISSYVVNSYIEKSKSVNSELVSTVFVDSLYLGDKVIKIQAYEESNIVWYDTDNTLINFKMYKFYLTDTSFLRLRELQNFYLKDVLINIPNQELINFFDDKFTVGHWKQSYDVVGSKNVREILVQLSTKEENRNSPGVITLSDTDLEPNNSNTLPSIDIFISGGDDFNSGTSSLYPRTDLGSTIDITNAYVIEGDFVSGLFKDSVWVSGNYMNYNKDYSIEQTNGIYSTASINTASQSITLNTPISYRPGILGFGDYLSNIVFTNGIYYDSTINMIDTGTNLVRLPDTWVITAITGSLTRDFTLQDVATQSTLSGWNGFTNQLYLTSRDAENKWNYLHPTKFMNSEIRSGIFRRAYFENCTFNNFELNIERELDDVLNKRKLLITDTIFDDNENIINSGVYQYTSFLGGSDIWNNGIFSDGIWDGYGPSWCFSPTGSVIDRTNTVFTNGCFRKSRWIYGVFNNGLFYKNNTNTGGVSTVYTDTASVYYRDSYLTRNAWLDGVFNNGEFEKSNFERGVFNNGNFYNSNFFTGEAFGGNFGKKNLIFDRTRVWTGTFSNVTSINADFKTENPTGVYNTQSISWYDGVFNNGRYGVQMGGSSSLYDPSTYLLTNTWHSGIFNGGDFEDVSKWVYGVFNNGRFRSYYGYNGIVGDPQTPFELSIATQSSFSWDSGVFNNGEFGRGSTGPNTTWFSGEFLDGVFNGRYWKDGILVRGKFNGHNDNITTDIDNYNQFILNYNYNYYGFWQSGYVSENRDIWNIDDKIWSNVKRVSDSKKISNTVEFKNMLWYSGTFSHSEGSMVNSVWLDGSHKKGLFKSSSFNPYMNLLEPYSKLSSWTQSSNGFIQIEDGVFTGTITGSPYSIELDILQPGQSYVINFTITYSDLNTAIYVNGSPASAENTIENISYSFVASSTLLELTIDGLSPIIGEELTFTDVVLFTGTQSGFRLTDTCIWENGIAETSDIYFSKWLDGTFKSLSTSTQGYAWGSIWKNGICHYMNAMNVVWKNGIWKNGNWNGSPFKLTHMKSGSIIAKKGFIEDILNNLGNYATASSNLSDYDTLHINHAFNYGTSSIIILSDNELTNGFGPGGSIYQDGSEWVYDSGSLFYEWDGSVWNSNLLSVYGYGYDDNTVYTSNTDTNLANTRLYATASDINVFSEGQYKIEVTYYISSTYSSYTETDTNNIRFEIAGMDPDLGGYYEDVIETYPIYSGFGSLYYGRSNVKTKTLFYTPTIPINTNINYTFCIRKDINPNTILHVLNIDIQEIDINYDLSINNQLNTLAWVPSLGSSISIPQNIIYDYGLATYGNGRFIKGIWENGVWNEGYRKDNTIAYSKNIQVLVGGRNAAWSESNNIWVFQLSVLEGVSTNPDIDNNYQVGDKVSIGNIITLDLNGDRRLVRETLLIRAIEGLIITLVLNIDFPIVGIYKDSDEHLIYITKNIWLNGVFLNGRFEEGVWSNGLFQGFPYITVMNNTHWIDGKFKGGRYIGLTSSYTDSDTGVVSYYNTGVIQKFEFYDENVSGQAYEFKYNSWIDVNFDTEVGVNINRVNEVYQLTPLLYESTFIENNFYGYPTKDVLESTATIRNGFDTKSRTYKLGWKYQEYTNLIPYDTEDQFIGVNDVRYFNGPSTWNYETLSPISETDSPIVSLYGINDFEAQGWTFSYAPVGLGFGDNGYSDYLTSINGVPSVDLTLNDMYGTRIRSNYGILPINEQVKLLISGGKPTLGNGVGVLSNVTLDVVNNTNINIENLRYSYIEITGEHLSFTPSNPFVGGEVNPIVFYNNFPSTYSIAARNIIINGNVVTLPLNQFATSSVVAKKEYFFNKKSLEMSLLAIADQQGSSRYRIGFDSIRVVETDMIPFFQFATDCFVRKSFATWDTADIDWNEAGLAPLYGTISEITGVGYPVWNNFYINDVSSCINYINQDVKIPYTALSPDLTYDISNINYISSVNVTFVI